MSDKLNFRARDITSDKVGLLHNDKRVSSQRHKANLPEPLCQSLTVSYKVEQTPDDPATPFLNIYPRKMKTCVQI